MPKRRRLQGRESRRGRELQRKNRVRESLQKRSRFKKNDGIYVDKKSKVKDNAALGI